MLDTPAHEGWTGHADPAAPENDATRLIDTTRQYIHDFDEALASSSGGEEVVSKMTVKYPDLGNPYTLWLASLYTVVRGLSPPVP
jgi:hypothetical protein